MLGSPPKGHLPSTQPLQAHSPRARESLFPPTTEQHARHMVPQLPSSLHWPRAASGQCQEAKADRSRKKTHTEEPGWWWWPLFLHILLLENPASQAGCPQPAGSVHSATHSRARPLSHRLPPPKGWRTARPHTKTKCKPEKKVVASFFLSAFGGLADAESCRVQPL